MLSLVLWAALQLHPHAKKTPAPAPAPDRPAILPDGSLHLPNSYCDRSGDGFFYLGPDGLIGIGQASCDAAFADWRTTGKVAVLPRA